MFHCFLRVSYGFSRVVVPSVHGTPGLFYLQGTLRRVFQGLVFCSVSLGKEFTPTFSCRGCSHCLLWGKTVKVFVLLF